MRQQIEVTSKVHLQYFHRKVYLHFAMQHF